MDYSGNPFAALSLIAAPAVLTNACSVLVMSTSNRLARTLDRARVLTRQLELDQEDKSEKSIVPQQVQEAISLRELHAAEQRTILLMRALQLFYIALSGFAGSVFLAIFGAVVVTGIPAAGAKTVEVIAVIVGFGAVTAVVSGSILLVRETRIAVAILHEQAQHIQARVKHRLQS